MEWYLVELHTHTQNFDSPPLARAFLQHDPTPVEIRRHADIDAAALRAQMFQTTATPERERWIKYDPDKHWLKVIRLGKGTWRGDYLANSAQHASKMFRASLLNPPQITDNLLSTLHDALHPTFEDTPPVSAPPLQQQPTNRQITLIVAGIILTALVWLALFSELVGIRPYHNVDRVGTEYVGLKTAAPLHSPLWGHYCAVLEFSPQPAFTPFTVPAGEPCDF